MPAFDPLAFDPGFDIGSVSTGLFFGGFDPFDSLMNATAEILENQGSTDDYGQKSNQVQDFVTIATQACRVSTDSPGRPHEYVVEKQSSVDFARVFMRPPSLPGNEPLTTHHWLRIEGEYFNIFNVLVLRAESLVHHYEVICRIVTP